MREFNVFGLSLSCGKNVSTLRFIFLAILITILGASLSFLLTWGIVWLIITLFELPILATWNIALGVWLILIVVKSIIRGAINTSKIIK